MKNTGASIKRQRVVGAIFSYALLIILAIVWLYPILWIILNSFRTERNDLGELIGTVVSNYWPKSVGFDNFVYLFKETLFPRWFLNTFIVAFFTFIISTVLSLSMAYVMSKLRFKSRKLILNLNMIMGLFPGFMSIIAIYYILKAMGLTQSLFALILVYSAGAGMGFYVGKGYFDLIPNALIESARIEGCNNFQILTKIILPMSKPIIIYTALMSFMSPWMDFIFARVILGPTNVELHTVAVGLYNLMFGGGAQNDPSFFTIFAAGSVIVSIPIVILFLSLQKYYVQGVTAGAVKG